jgi:hypothetical protein
LLRMSARDDVVAQYFTHQGLVANTPLVKEAVVGPDEAGVVMRDGRVEEIVSHDRIKNLGGSLANRIASRLGGGQNVDLLLITTSPFELRIPVGGRVIREGATDDEPLLTQDGHRVMGWTNLHLAFNTHDAPKVLNLMRSMRSKMYSANDLTKADLVARLYDELASKVLVPVVRRYTVDQIRGGAEVTRELDAAILTDMSKTFDLLGIRLVQVVTHWGPTEFERIQALSVDTELAERRKEVEWSARMNDEKRAHEARKALEQFEFEHTKSREANEGALRVARVEWEEAEVSARHNARVERERVASDAETKHLRDLVDLKKNLKMQKLEEENKEIELEKIRSQADVDKARAESEKERYHLEAYERGMDKALGMPGGGRAGRAVAQGVESNPCPKCLTPNGSAARYCSGCGAALQG